MGAHAVAPQPPGRGQLKHAGKAAVVGEKQEPLGVEVKPAHADEARQLLRQKIEDGRAPARVAVRGQKTSWLVKQKKPRALAPGQRLPVDRNDVLRRYGYGRRKDSPPRVPHPDLPDASLRPAPR